jgi:hypothetical protein
MSEHESEHVDVPVEQSTKQGRSRGIVAPIASAVAVVLVAGGGFAAWRFLSDPGTAPAEVLPSSTFALATVDLDPSGSQKIEAYRALRKFPALREKVGSDSGDDVVEKLVTDALEESGCQGLSYARDFEPWLGKSFAAGGVRLGDAKPTWVVAIESTDDDKASAAMGDLAACATKSGDGGLGWASAEGYVLASDTTSHAQAIAAAGKKDPLSADTAYQKWMGAAADDAGIAGFYVAKGAPGMIADLIDQEAAGATGDAKPGESVRTGLKDFQGMGAVLRFADGGFELSVAAGGVKQDGAPKVADQVRSLPADTAAVLSIATPDELVDTLAGTQGAGSDALAQSGLGMFLPGKEDLESLGLTLPDDLETLLGSQLSLALGGTAPADLDRAGSTDIPFGLLVKSDPAKFQEVVGKVERATGTTLASIPAALETGDGRVAIASNPAYAQELVGQGDLGSQKVFRDVVPHADKATGIFFAQLDGSWRAALEKAAASGDKSERETIDNLEVLRAVGASSWQDGSTSHGLVRLSLR